MNKIGLYIRVSTEEQARIQEGSLVSQRQRLEEYVNSQNRAKAGWGAVIEVYCDEAKSAKDMNRSEFQRLLRDVKHGKINLILATELSRLSRSIKDFCHVWDFLKDHKAKFITLRDNFDTTTAAGELMLFNLINYAQFERKQTAERLVANFTARAYRGLWNGGTIPLGYKRALNNPGTLEIDETDAETLKTIFRVFLKTGSLHETCRALTQMGIRTKSYTNKRGEDKGGNLFTVQSLHHVLTNATVIGLREINKKRGNTERVKASWPAILDKETFDQVQKRLEMNRRKFKPNEWKRYPYPLTGIVKCGECGLSLNGKSAHGKTKRHHYYDHPRTLRSYENGHVHTCASQRLRAEKIEDQVLGSLKRILQEPGRLEKAIAAYRKSQNTDAPRVEREIKRAATALKETQRKIKNLVDRISELPPEVSVEPIYRRLEELQAKSLEQQKAVSDLERQKGLSTHNVQDEVLRTTVLKTIQQLDKAPKEDQRQIFENVIQFAEFHPKSRIRLGVYADRESGAAVNGGSASSGYSIFGDQGCSPTIKVGGESEIRTHGSISTTHAFQACALNHSATSPYWNVMNSSA